MNIHILKIFPIIFVLISLFGCSSFSPSLRIFSLSKFSVINDDYNDIITIKLRGDLKEKAKCFCYLISQRDIVINIDENNDSIQIDFIHEFTFIPHPGELDFLSFFSERSIVHFKYEFIDLPFKAIFKEKEGLLTFQVVPVKSLIISRYPKNYEKRLIVTMECLSKQFEYIFLQACLNKEFVMPFMEED